MLCFKQCEGQVHVEWEGGSDKEMCVDVECFAIL